ncbi:MAG: TlpA family protein disulfide reductase [Luteimonas sp.]
MKSNLAIVLVAMAAAGLGFAASLLVSGSPLLLRSEVGQRALGWWMSATSAAPSGVAVARRGEALPPLRLSTLDGRVVSLPTDYAGRPLLVNVWASWCGPCIREMPALQRFHAEQGGNGIQVVGIALDDPQAVRAFLGRAGVRYPILVDTPGPADAGVRLGNPKGILPYSVLVSSDGRLLRQHLGPLADDEIAQWARP